MKRTLCIIAAILLALCICACSKGGDAPQPTEAPPSPSQDLSLYDKSEGKLTREVRYNADGLKFNTVDYEYDENGRLVKETTLGINNAPVGYKEYVLNENGLVETMINYIADGPEEYSEEYRVLFEYNESGLRMKETNMISSEVTAVTTYAYEGKNLVSEKYYEGTELISDVVYEYDDAGNLARLVRHDMLEDSEDTENYSYDGSGRLTQKEVSSDGSLTSRTEYTYDEHGNELSVKVCGPDGSTVSATVNEYEYDAPGNVVKCTVTHGDGEQSTVVEYMWSYVKG